MLRKLYTLLDKKNFPKDKFQDSLNQDMTNKKSTYTNTLSSSSDVQFIKEIQKIKDTTLPKSKINKENSVTNKRHNEYIQQASLSKYKSEDNVTLQHLKIKLKDNQIFEYSKGDLKATQRLSKSNSKLGDVKNDRGELAKYSKGRSHQRDNTQILLPKENNLAENESLELSIIKSENVQAPELKSKKETSNNIKTSEYDSVTNLKEFNKKQLNEKQENTLSDLTKENSKKLSKEELNIEEIDFQKSSRLFIKSSEDTKLSDIKLNLGASTLKLSKDKSEELKTGILNTTKFNKLKSISEGTQLIDNNMTKPENKTILLFESIQEKINDIEKLIVTLIEENDDTKNHQTIRISVTSSVSEIRTFKSIKLNPVENNKSTMNKKKISQILFLTSDDIDDIESDNKTTSKMNYEKDNQYSNVMKNKESLNKFEYDSNETQRDVVGHELGKYLTNDSKNKNIKPDHPSYSLEDVNIFFTKTSLYDSIDEFVLQNSQVRKEKMKHIINFLKNECKDNEGNEENTALIKTNLKYQTDPHRISSKMKDRIDLEVGLAEDVIKLSKDLINNTRETIFRIKEIMKERTTNH